MPPKPTKKSAERGRPLYPVISKPKSSDVPKPKATTPYQMSTRPPKQGTNTKRVVATTAAKEGYDKRIMNKKPKLSDKKYGQISGEYRPSEEYGVKQHKADLKDWNKVNKGVVATPNKKPTAAQKKYTATQKLRKTYDKHGTGR